MICHRDTETQRRAWLARTPLCLCVSVALLFVNAACGQTKPTSRPGGEIVPPPRRDVPGKRVELKSGELFVPDFFRTDGRADVVVWFLGTSWCAEQVFYDAHKNAVLLVVNAATLKRGFDFLDALEEVAGALDHQADVTDEGIGSVSLISFSGGWSGVRDVLSHPDLARVVDNVVLLDSLYARDEKSLAPFVEFAKRACDGETTFVFTQLYPPLEEHRGNTTTVCAMKLIEQLKLVRDDANEKVGERTLLYRAIKGNAHILGYSGMTNQDHFDHFYNAARAIRMTSVRDAR